MQPRYEEKTFESYFNTELDHRANVYFPFGQVQEGGIGADAASYSRNRWLWRRLGHRYFLHPPFKGVDLRDIAEEMEIYICHEIKNIPSLKANLLFQYKRPHLITNKRGSEWHHWNQKYFKYDIDQYQQTLLAHLDSKFGNQALVLYASPALEDVNDLVGAKIRGKIIENTNFRKAAELTGHQRNTYIKAGTHSIACSEPERHETFDLLDTLRKMEGIQSEKKSDWILNFSEEVRLAATKNSFLGAAYEKLLDPIIKACNGQYPLFFAISIMRVFREVYGTQWVLATDGDITRNAGS
jgi:hypothetical protein